MKKLISALLAFALSGPSASAIAQNASAAAIRAEPALWVVKDTDTTLYLFGTIHLMKPEIQWFEGKVKAAYDASDELVFEIADVDPVSARTLVARLAIDPDGPPLLSKLPAKTETALRKVLAELNIPPASFDQYEPWYVATLLGLIPLQKHGLSTESGVEKILEAAAKRDGKKIVALETIEQQLGYFDTLPEPLQIVFLEETMKALPDYDRLVDTMIAAWSDGKSEVLAGSISKAMRKTPAIRQRLLGDRNLRWADWIAKRMEQPGTVFLAVGAGHLAGKDSVQRKLKPHKLKAIRTPS
jgi:uncharacterized protein